MKLTDHTPQSPDGKHRSEQRQVIKQKQLTGRLIIKRGQTVFEYDLATEECRKAAIENTSAVMADNSKTDMQNDVTIRHNIQRKDNHLYCAALNIKNAQRKFDKMLADLVRKGILIKT